MLCFYVEMLLECSKNLTEIVLFSYILAKGFNVEICVAFASA